MKTRRFRLRYSAPHNSERWNCDWIRCDYGIGFAGRGECSANPRGEWWNAKCPQFEIVENFLRLNLANALSSASLDDAGKLYFRKCCGEYKKPTELCCLETNNE